MSLVPQSSAWPLLGAALGSVPVSMLLGGTSGAWVLFDVARNEGAAIPAHHQADALEFPADLPRLPLELLVEGCRAKTLHV